ncbi:hypothetical protein PV327_010569 [Microctonus hyperodae]|uniref:tRNA (uracil-O(2)-)-methyltransferase n=1 Tax=Microctonus hyperodae TaxID=165561 RepID=A0AA39FSL9_MICHY|nr:hypothetical protein PV327_010569 [Microctonus hyperodae]
MDFQLLASKKINATLNEFWAAISIWLNNPHLINKRISSSKIILKAKLNVNNVESVINNLVNIDDVSELIKNDMSNNIESLNVIELSPLSIDMDLFTEINNEGIFLIIKKLFPRNNDKFTSTVEFTIVDKNNLCIISLHKRIDNEKNSLGIVWPYKIMFNDDLKEISIMLNNIENNSTHASIEWYKNKLFPCLIKWMENNDNYNDKNSFIKQSLSLVSIEKYTELYTNLKKKYGAKLVENWSESTDPKKYVYEDIAIASYLILLWQQEREEKIFNNKQTFVDLGCGNGLLAYILTNEGYSGLGIDLRKRKIWNLFTSTTQLEERAIIPSSSSLFPNTDWLIGNHSDELTPWIPVIAARSSYKCRFFLLPCCAHEFDGRKYQRDSASNSQYHQYLIYIKTICETCGFVTKLDRLRIPSTKRICFIGWARNYTEDQSELKDKRIEEIINARSLTKKSLVNNSEGISVTKWSDDFKPRDPIEKARNCTQIDRNIINEIIDLIANNLLRKVRIINSPDDDNKKWNAGGSIELSEIANIIPSTTLKQLKNECGGLQTLLRNNSHIFQINNGLVQFRIANNAIENTRNRKKRKKKPNSQLKVKPCWFFNNHPDGCLLTDEKCNFKHE